LKLLGVEKFMTILGFIYVKAPAASLWGITARIEKTHSLRLVPYFNTDSDFEFSVSILISVSIKSQLDF
jgi:hypothetical protein